MSDKVFLSDAKVALITLRRLTSNGFEDTPAIGVRADLSAINDEMQEYLEEVRSQIPVESLATSFIVATFFMKKATLTDPSPFTSNAMVDVAFYINQVTKNQVVFRIPKQFLSVAVALSGDNIEEDSVPIALFDGNKYSDFNPTRIYSFKEPSFFLSLRDLFSQEETLAEDFSEALPDRFSFPRSTIPFNDPGLPQESYVEKLSQSVVAGDIMNRTFSFLHGDFSPFVQTPSEFIEDNMNLLTRYLPFLLRVGVSASISDPEHNSAYSTGENSKEKQLRDMQFMNLMQSNGVDQILAKTMMEEGEESSEDESYMAWLEKSQNWNKRFDADGWRKEFSGIEEYLKDNKLDKAVADIASFGDLGELESFTSEYGIDLVINALCLRFAEYAFRFKELAGEKNPFKPRDFLMNWLNDMGVDGWWQARSLGINVYNASFATPMDVVLSGSGTVEDKGFHAPYIIPFVAEFARNLIVVSNVNFDNLGDFGNHIDKTRKIGHYNTGLAKEGIETLSKLVHSAMKLEEESELDVDEILSIPPQALFGFVINALDVDRDSEPNMAEMSGLVKSLMSAIMVFGEVLADDAADRGTQDWEKTCKLNLGLLFASMSDRVPSQEIGYVTDDYS